LQIAQQKTECRERELYSPDERGGFIVCAGICQRAARRGSQVTFPKGILSGRAAGWLAWCGSQRATGERGKIHGQFLFMCRFKRTTYRTVKEV